MLQIIALVALLVFCSAFCGWDRNAWCGLKVLFAIFGSFVTGPISLFLAGMAGGAPGAGTLVPLCLFLGGTAFGGICGYFFGAVVECIAVAYRRGADERVLRLDREQSRDEKKNS